MGLGLFRRAGADTPHFPFRSTGAAADAFIARYAMAAGKARPGDSIFVDGAAASVGAEILAALSRAGNITCDADPGEAAPNRFDLIVAFDSPSIDGWRARLDIYARLLKPDGRIVVGWRRLDDVSAPADWHGFHAALCERFLLEARYHHIVPGPDTDQEGRALHPVSIDAPQIGNWLIAIASANPLEGADLRADYRHPAFDHGDGPLPTVVDFRTAYDNPYLYRTMVQMGERLGDDMKLARLAEIVSQDSAPASADRGAAITVLGYRVLELRLEESVMPIIRLIEQYRLATAGEKSHPHVARWRISQAFLAARLYELAGDHPQAIRWFNTAAQGEWRIFSPLLATKAVAASFHEGRLHLAGNDMPAAHRCFRRGLDASLEALSFPHGELLGAHERPLPFYMQELAEVADMGSQCGNALANFDLWERDPGLFWRQVDIRRFGLASWARDLERENKSLRLSAGH